MHYPFWYIPYLPSPMLIAIIAVMHVLVSHYAVGGGLFLAMETSHAYRTGNHKYLEYLKSHAWFFILLTVVFGAITGVGIWWTIGLTSPLATQTLIQTFVFGWATEYVTFILEITSAFIFYYYWGKLSPKVHQIVGWIYAISAWLSLFLITGITAFMLNPGSWLQNPNFWRGFFNPQLIPQTLARTGGAFLLASFYVYLHASFKIKEKALCNLIETRSARPALLGAILIIIGGIGWYLFLPASSKSFLLSAAVLNVLMLLIFAITAIVFVMLYFGPYKNPGWLSPPFAIFFLIFGFAAMTTGEYIREAIRKPYIIYNVVMSNQILAKEIPYFRKKGYLESGIWTKMYVKKRYPELIDDKNEIDESKLIKLPEAEQIKLGRVLFQYHCGSCHSSTGGYSSVKYLTKGWDYDTILGVVEDPHMFNNAMPPWAGTSYEAEILAKYILSISASKPSGMYYGNK